MADKPITGWFPSRLPDPLVGSVGVSVCFRRSLYTKGFQKIWDGSSQKRKPLRHIVGREAVLLSFT